MLVALIQGGGPAGEKGQCVLGWAVGFGAVGGEGQPGVGREFHDLVGEAEVAYHGVMELFGAGPVQAHVWVAQRLRKVSLRVDSSPMRSDRPRS